VLKMLHDPDIAFSVVPERLQVCADFMHATGVVKIKAADWKELAFPHLYGLQGS